MHCDSKTPILIYGPTASGKSAAALKLAIALDGIIVNADALQVYSAYQILTARPSGAEIAQAPHLLYGYIGNAKADYSVGTWLIDVGKALEKNNKIPIFIGGTGLYFRALTQGLVDIPPTPPELRDALETRFARDGLAALVAHLAKVDPATYANIDRNNPRRVIRALEVYENTGKPMSYWHAQTPAPILEVARKFMLSPPAEALRARIAKRSVIMLETGAIDEVARQMPFDPALPANKAIGAPEIARYLTGGIDFHSMQAALINKTAQYAKRQRSWGRSHMADWQKFDDADALITAILRP